MPSKIDKIESALDGGTCFVFPDKGIIAVWNNSLTVNLYDENFNCLDCFSFSNTPNEYEVREEILDRLKSDNDNDDDLYGGEEDHALCC